MSVTFTRTPPKGFECYRSLPSLREIENGSKAGYWFCDAEIDISQTSAKEAVPILKKLSKEVPDCVNVGDVIIFTEMNDCFNENIGLWDGARILPPYDYKFQINHKDTELDDYGHVPSKFGNLNKPIGYWAGLIAHKKQHPLRTPSGKEPHIHRLDIKCGKMSLKFYGLIYNDIFIIGSGKRVEAEDVFYDTIFYVEEVTDDFYVQGEFEFMGVSQSRIVSLFDNRDGIDLYLDGKLVDKESEFYKNFLPTDDKIPGLYRIM